MRADATFTVKSFVPAEITPAFEVTTGAPVGVATMEKLFEGEAAGRSATVFTAAFDHATGVGTYIAMESFEGTLHGRAGTFNFAHSATTTGSDRLSPFFVIVPGSGTAALTGITGAGSLTVDQDGTHHITFEYELADQAS